MIKKKKNILKNMIFASIMAASVLLFTIIMEKSILSDYDKVKVVVAKVDIPARTFITDENKNDYFQVKEIPADAVLDNIFTSVDEATGHMINTDMQKNEQLTGVKVKNIDADIFEQYNNPVEISLMVDNISYAVSGTLRKGDIVDVASYVYTDMYEKEIQVILENVYISGTYDTSGEEVFVDSDKNTSVIFSLILEKEDYLEFLKAADNGGIQLIKVENIG